VEIAAAFYGAGYLLIGKKKYSRPQNCGIEYFNNDCSSYSLVARENEEKVGEIKTAYISKNIRIAHHNAARYSHKLSEFFLFI